MTDEGHAAREVPAPPAVAGELLGPHLPAMEHYVAILATRGVDHGLVGPREVPRLWDRHILNCVVIADLIAPDATVADVGSGAGLPGLVLAVARPDLRLHLIEPLQRRVTWLEGAVAELGLQNVTIHRGKAQAFWGEVEADVVTSRAVARTGELVDWCLPLVRPGGEIMAIKGASAASEIAQDEAQLVTAGMESVAVEVVGEGRLDVPTTVVRVRGTARELGHRASGARRSGVRSSGSRAKGKGASRHRPATSGGAAGPGARRRGNRS